MDSLFVDSLFDDRGNDEEIVPTFGCVFQNDSGNFGIVGRGVLPHGRPSRKGGEITVEAACIEFVEILHVFQDLRQLMEELLPLFFGDSQMGKFFEFFEGL
jgi:hypothetical protein